MQWLWLSAAPDLVGWENALFSAGIDQGPGVGDHRDHHQRIVAIDAPGPPIPSSAARRLANAILRFDVFPPHLAAGVLRRRPVEMGDTVGLRYHFMPGLDLFFAARVIDRFEAINDQQWRCGFTYRTLQGHPACGEETFVVEKDLASGRVTAALRSWSRPGMLIATLTYPLMRRFQLRAGQAALDHLQTIAYPELPDAPSLPIRSQTLVARRNRRTGILRSDRV